jgi:UPF0755 protein
MLLLSGLFIYTFFKIYKESVIKDGFLYLKSNDNFNHLVKKISPFIKDTTDFKWVAKQKKFKNIKSGRYFIKKGLSNNDLINLLRSGKQTPVKLTFNNQNSLEELAKRISEQIEPDYTSLIKAFTDEKFLIEKGFTKRQALGMYLPNSYEVYWNISAEKFRDKMYKEYTKFWNKSRLSKAKRLNLTPIEVTTLASIVHKESTKNEERPIIAGLYLNRLKDGWPLESDPTVIFANKLKYGNDLKIRRVLFKNIEAVKNSPYNTYKVKGLPPSLIAMPDISAIEAVLNPDKNDYYFMCASVNRVGYHEFAKTLAQHSLNAKKYHNKKNNQGIRQ